MVTSIIKPPPSHKVKAGDSGKSIAVNTIFRQTVVISPAAGDLIQDSRFWRGNMYQQRDSTTSASNANKKIFQSV